VFVHVEVVVRVISPYVRRLRLGDELRAMRTAARLTHEQVAKRIGVSRAQVSRLENGHAADQADVMKILDALGIEGERWTTVMTVAREAGEKGWWESTRGIGERQALVANLEAGAVRIRQYEQAFIPGLLQIPEFVRAQITAASPLEPLEGTPDGVLAGRAGRQRMLRRPGAPSYEVIIDELAIRRLAAPPGIVKKQLFHLAGTGNARPPAALRVLPIDAVIEGYAVPRCSFTVYDYPDTGDPQVVAVDTVTDDLILTSPASTAPYDQLYARLTTAALTPDQTLELLTTTAHALPDN
jgi:transcriptional regulator with XRE-family HTH domain